MVRKKNLATILEQHKREFDSAVEEAVSNYRTDTINALTRITENVYGRGKVDEIQAYDIFVARLERSEESGLLHKKLDQLTGFLSAKQPKKSQKKSKKNKESNKAGELKQFSLQELRDKGYSTTDRSSFISRLKNEYGLEGRKAQSYWMNHRRYSQGKTESENSKKAEVTYRELSEKSYPMNRGEFLTQLERDYGITGKTAHGYWIMYKGKTSQRLKKLSTKVKG